MRIEFHTQATRCSNHEFSDIIWPICNHRAKPLKSSGRASLTTKQVSRCMLAFVAFNFVCLFNSTTPAPGEERPKPSLEKWRPKGGTYAEPGVAFNARCGEYGDTQIDWEANAINGGEEGCKIVKLSDTGPAAIRLDVVCTDIEREKPYKETILLKKIDDTTIYLRETQNGKFKRAGGSMAYCPEEAQRLYAQSRNKRY
jgi:hypothetical protein